MEEDDEGAARGSEEELGRSSKASGAQGRRSPGECGEEEKSPRYETAAEESDSPEKESSPLEDAARARAEQRRLARQRAALNKHLARCGGPSASPTPRSPSSHKPELRRISPEKRSPRNPTPARSTKIRLEIGRSSAGSDHQHDQHDQMSRQPRSISLRLDDIKGKGRTTQRSRSPKRTRSHGDIEVIRIEAPESTGPSYSSVVFPMPYSGSGGISEIFPSGSLPPEPKPARPVKCPPTERDAITASRSKARDKKKHHRNQSRGVPSFVPREVIAEKNAWKSGLCDCWGDPESYWSGVMEQVV